MQNLIQNANAKPSFAGKMNVKLRVRKKRNFDKYEQCILKQIARKESSRIDSVRALFYNLLGASFRTVDQLKRLAPVGCHAVTITPAMFDAMIAHPSTDESMDGFRKAWKTAFGDMQISDMIP